MFFAIFGLLAGIGMPMQTSINTELGKRAGSPFTAALLNFLIGMAALTIFTLFAEGGMSIPFDDVFAAPPWYLFGGVLGVVFIVGNILLMPRLGSVQTAILPALGQIIMGTLIDTFGWLSSEQRPMSILRIIGVALVFAGVLTVIFARSNTTLSKAVRPIKYVWIWRALGLMIGVSMAAQTAINSHLGVVVDSRLYAAMINFTVGTTLLIILQLLTLKTKKPWDHSEKSPAWIWSGGLFGALFVVGNIVTAQTVGTGMAVVLLLTGLMIGGILVDQFGLFRSAKRRVGKFEILGVLVMIIGAVIFHLT